MLSASDTMAVFLRLLALLMAVVLPVSFAWAAQHDPVKPASTETAKEAVRVCTKCHDESEEKPILAILKTKHAMMADKRTPFADEACITCHGPSEEHLVKPPEGEKPALPDITFKEEAPISSTKKNEVCLSCHESGLRLHWKGSQHEFRGLACSSCHNVHVDQDPTLVRLTQPETCFNCHKEQRAQAYRPSRHPIREGKVVCSDCHNPHGSTGPKQLAKNSVNETCYACHYEKRGPFLWEHAPARDDCTNCHKPHGSIHPALLKNRGPWLCQQCHLAQFHPSTAYSGTGIPPRGAAQQLLGKNCLNCHSQVHGSNHPSGIRLTR
ncbi:MAG: DmsE family decaheme c-type cytochrome [Gammaproteobacteria bacterium]|nr:DmsE family decaheme c-type cytochrome [Gammaproteobacteria bacterium]